MSIAYAIHIIVYCLNDQTMLYTMDVDWPTYMRNVLYVF